MVARAGGGIGHHHELQADRAARVIEPEAGPVQGQVRSLATGRFHGWPGSQADSSSSLVGVSVVWWMTAMAAR